MYSGRLEYICWNSFYPPRCIDILRNRRTAFLDSVPSGPSNNSNIITSIARSWKNRFISDLQMVEATWKRVVWSPVQSRGGVQTIQHAFRAAVFLLPFYTKKYKSTIQLRGKVEGD